VAYADRKGLEPDVFDALWTVLRRLNEARQRWLAEEAKGAAGGGG
jgi:hypothetical protein